MDKKEFIKLFAKKIKEKGFDKKRNTLFYRNTPSGFVATALDLKEEIYGLKINVHISFRIDKIEEFVRMFPENPVGKELPTFQIDLGYLVDEKQKFWFIKPKDDLVANIYLSTHDKVGLPNLDMKFSAEDVIDEIILLVEKYGFPFLEKFSNNLQDLFLLLSSEEVIMLKSIYLQNILAKQLITIAFILKQKQLFERLVLTQRSLILEKYAFDIENFDHLTNYLRSKF